MLWDSWVGIENLGFWFCIWLLIGASESGVEVVFYFVDV